MSKNAITRKGIGKNLSYAPEGLGVNGPVSARTRRRALAKIRRKKKRTN